MIKLQRIQAQGTQDLVMSANMTVKLRPGESLLLDHSGVKTLRVGLDLVLLLPTGETDANGKPVVLRLVVTEFFSQSANTQVVVTSADEPVQMLTPESEVPTDMALDAQAANASTDIEALQEQQSLPMLLDQASVQTQSTSFEMESLLATNVSASFNWQTQLTQRPDTQIIVKLQSVNAPQPPVLFPFNSPLTYPKNGGLLAVNKAMVQGGYKVQGTADANSSVTVVLKYADTANTVTIPATVDGSGKFSAQLPFKLLNASPTGVYSITAYSTDTLQAISPPSNSQSLYIDVKPPEKVVFDLNTSKINLNAGFINKTNQSDMVFQGTAEANALIKFSWTNKAGLTNPGDGSYTTQADANGNWQWQLSPDMARQLLIASNGKTQYLNVQVTATDELGNESNAMVFNSVGLDLTAPDVPELQIELTDSVQSDGASYKTLSQKSLDQSTIFKGNFFEPNGKIIIRLKNQGGVSKEFENITVASDGTWSRKFSAGDLSSLGEGECQVFVRGVDEAKNESDWSSPQTIWLDVDQPGPPKISDLPTGNFSIDIQGYSDGLKVVNAVALRDTQKKFSGTAEVGSTVYLTLYNAANAANDIKQFVLTKPDGTWEISLSPTDWSALSEGVIFVSAVARDLSGNPSLVSEKKYFYLDTTPPADPTVQFSDAVMGRPNPDRAGIRFLNRDDLQNGTLITGTADKGSMITLKINGRTLSDKISVRDDGTWTYTLVNSPTNDWTSVFTDGALSVQVVATDIARNTSREVNYNGIPVEKHTERPTAAQNLKLILGDDTGRASEAATLTDNKTNKPTPTLEWNIGLGLKTYIWADTDKDGELDASEKNPNAVDPSNIASQTNVQFQVTMTAQGPQKYFVVTQDEWGNFSEPQSIIIILDATVNNPVFDGFQGDTNLSLEEFNNRANITLSGTTDEDGCVVSIALFDSTGTNQLSSWVEVRAVNKNWSTANFFNTLTLNQNGSFILRIFNTDEVGNTTQSRPLDIAMNIRSTPLQDVQVLRLSASTDTGNNRPNTNADNITNDSAPILTGQVPYDRDAELMVRLYNSEGQQLVSDADSPQIGQDGGFSFQLKQEWLTEGEPVKFIVRTYDKKTGTLSAVSKEINITLDANYDVGEFKLDKVTEDNVINYDEFNSTFVRPKIQGTSEVNSEISIVLSKTAGNSVITEIIQSSQITYTMGSDGKEYWSTDFTERMGNTLGDGRIEIQITAKDRTGNTYQHPVSYFDLKRGQLTAPQMLDLSSSDDTGVSNTDNITQGQAVAGSAKRSITLTGNTNTSSEVEVTLFDDKNKNGVLDAGDDTLETFSHSGAGVFQKTYQLIDGEYNFVNRIKDVPSGQSSATSDKLTVIIDSQIETPSDIAMGTNNLINALVYENSTFQITGKGEPNATVYLQFKLKSDLSTNLLTQAWTAQVNSEGTWRLNLTKTQMDALREGELIGYVSQTDRADNRSGTVEVALLFDKTPPSVPTPSDITATLDNYYTSNSFEKPWDRQDQGIVWTDIYSYNSGTQTQTAKFISLAIALPSSGSSVKSGDTVTLTWGEQVLSPVTVTAQDVTNAYVLVNVMGDTIDLQGKSDSLNVKAFFTDRSDNKSAEFNVLTNVKVSLDLKSPSLDLSQSSQKNLGDLTGQDTSWYSNKISTFKIKGVADPGATVTVYAKRADGTGSEIVLATIRADSSTGAYEQVVDLSAKISTNVRYAIQSQSKVGVIDSVRSDAEYLNVSSSAVSSPTLGMTTLGGDGYVNSLERNAGVPISGTGAPAYAKIQIKLTNTSTGVDYFVTPFYALQNGTWSYTLGITDWGVVGEGKISVAVKQTNIYGDESAFTTLANEVTFDATVIEPLLNTVSGDNYINLSEYNDSSSSVIQMSGKAEPGAKLSVTLTGTNGHVYTPGTQPVVRADGTWVLNLTQNILQALGSGKVTVALSQEDLAKNSSQTSKNTFFTIDLSSDDLSLNSVTSDNIVNDVEKDQGVTLSGNAEAGSWIQITLQQPGVADKVLSGFKANSSTWVYALSKQVLALYSEGVVTAKITQTDVSLNSTTLTQSFTLRSDALQAPTISTWGNSPAISLAEQVSNYSINGTGPANGELNVQFVRADGSRLNLPVVVIAADGKWQLQLTPAQMASLQGNTSLRYWATKADQSTAIQELSLRIDSNFPSPRLDEVGGDGSISLSDLSSDGELVITGDGEKFSTVTVSFKGSNNTSIASKDAVVNNQTGAWSVTLTRQELEGLTNKSGKVMLTLVQKDNNSDRTSVAITKSFDVDMLAPTLPTFSEQTDAKNFNTVASGNNFSSAADGTVSDTDAKAGVVIAVPVAKVGGNFVLGTGDSVTIRWGDQLFTKLLTASDVPVGRNYILVTVPLEVIAKAGAQNNLTVAVSYTDKFGNSSLPLTLISNLVVTPPPPAPSVDTISKDGFINKNELTELTELTSNVNGLAIEGQSSQNTGRVSLVFTTSLDPNNPIKTINDIPVGSNGKWTASLSADLLNKWVDGQYFVFATYAVNGRTSVVTKSVFEIDRVVPNSPLGSSQTAANLANAQSELSGGIIRPRINGSSGNSAVADRYDTALITEAAEDVNVRVALPANAKIGDAVVLTWGDTPADGKDNTVTQAVSNADISRGFMSVRVPSLLIAELGDFTGDNTLTIKAQFFDNAKNPGPVFEVISGLQVDAVPLPVKTVSSNFGDWLNLETAQSGWKFLGECDKDAEIEITMVGSSGHKTQPIRFWKDARNQIQTSDGQWTVSEGLDAALARALGEGLVFVSIIQRDKNGNPSAAYESSFRIDLTPPAAPPIDDISKLTFSTYAEGKTITGRLEKNAVVTVKYELLNQAGQVEFTSAKKTATINGDTWSDTLSKQAFDEFLTKLPAGTTGGKLRVKVFQTDLANNDSVESTKEFSFESAPLTAPSVSAVTGLDFSNASPDAVLSQSDLSGRASITVQGNSSVAGSQTRLVLQKINGLSKTWDIQLPSGVTTWSKDIAISDFTQYGDGDYKLMVSTRVLDINGNPENESLAKTLTFNGQDFFTLDTNGPLCQSMEISANGTNGNAAVGDEVKVVLNFSEFIKVNTSSGSPNIVLTGFSDGRDREATYVSNNAQTKQMVFRYTVESGTNASSGDVRVKEVVWNNAQVTDLYGNERSASMPAVTQAHSVIVDTTPPTYTPVIMSISGTDGSSAGGDYIIEKESNDVTVRINLSGLSINELGASLVLNWNGVDLPTYQIKSDDFTTGYVDIPIDKNVLTGLEENVNLKVKLLDIAGNPSPEATTLINIDTKKPGQLTIDRWMDDDLISATEYASLTDITGSGIESGTVITAKIFYNSGTLASPDFTVTPGANSTWSISRDAIKQFLDTSIGYGAFELRVWQTDVRGNESDKAIGAYFLDKEVPNAPREVEISGVGDGWLNANEASRVELKIEFDTQNSPKANDKLNISFWKYTYKQAQRPADAAADFSLNDVVITAADIAAGYKLVTLTTSTLQQTNGQPVQEIDFEVKIIDQGNNVSLVKRSTAHLDTQVNTPIIDTDPSTVVGGVTPTGAQSNQYFKGSGIELLVNPDPSSSALLANSTNLTIIFRSQYGNKITKTHVPYDSNGKFEQVLTSADFRYLVGGGRTEAVVYYEVFQTDKADNVSGKVVDSFNVSLALSPPVLQSFTGDNIVNKVELAAPQTVSGVTVPQATVTVKLFVKNADNSVRQVVEKTVGSDLKGDWSVPLTTTDLSDMTSGQPDNFTAYFEATTSKSGQASESSQLDFQVIRSVPSQVGGLEKFDANGDGANNDGLQLSLTDNVLVRDLVTELKSKGMASGKWGKNFRIDAVDSVKVNGDYYAKIFRIYLGADHSLSSTTPIVLSRLSLINVANNLPTTDLSLSPPTFSVPITINMDPNKSGDNMLNSSDLQRPITFKMYMVDDRANFKPLSNDKYTVFLNGQKVTALTDKPLTDFSNFTTSTNWQTNTPILSVTMGSTEASQIKVNRQGLYTLTAQIYSPDTKSYGYYSVPHTFMVDTQVDTEVKQIKVVDADNNGSASASDKLYLTFAEAVNLSAKDLPGVTVNGVFSKVFGVGASVKAIGGVYTPTMLDNTQLTTSKPNTAEALDAANEMLKSNVWEITLGTNPTWTPGTSFELSNLRDNFDNVSTSFTVETHQNLYDQPGSLLIDVVSTDNVISATDAAAAAPVNVSVKLSGAKVGDVVKLYMDGTANSNLMGSVTLTQADVNAKTVSFAVNDGQWGGDGMRNLTATIQRGSGSVVTSDMRNVSVSVNEDHWSATGKIIWFDTDNIVQDTGSNVTTWQASVGGSVATAFTSSNMKAPMLVRNAVNGHNQLFFSGPEYTYDQAAKKWVSTATTNGVRNGSFMYFNDPDNIFATYTHTKADVVDKKISYTVIANGRKDTGQDGFLTSIGANGNSGGNGWKGGDFKLATGNVGLSYQGNNILNAYQGQNRTGLPNVGPNPNQFSIYNFDYSYLTPGQLADLGYNPYSTQFQNGMVIPVNSGTLGTQLLLSHVYDASPYGDGQVGDLSFYSNSQLIGHRVTDYKIVLGGGKPAADLTSYTSGNDPEYKAIMATQFLIGAVNQTNTPRDTSLTMNDIEKNVTSLWRGMIGDIVWAAKAIKGAALQEINAYQAVKFGTVGTFVKPSSKGAAYDLSASADSMNLLDDVLLLNQSADAGNGAETVTVAGADYVTTGHSNDTIILKDLNFRVLDGGKGEDTLKLHADFSIKSVIYLSDYVSNSRGDSTDADDNSRVNFNGFHKLSGFETIDLSSNTKAQTLSLNDSDVWQLSDTRSLKIKMDNQDLLLTKNLGSRLQGHFFVDSTFSWYDGFYAPSVNAKAVTLYTQGGDRLTSLYSFDLSNNNKILDLNFDDSLKINVGSTLSMGDFSVSGLGPYNFSMSGLNPTTVSFNDLQQSLRFQSTNSINGPLLIKYTGTELQDTQGRPIPSYTWMIGSDLPNQDYDNYQILNANRLTQAEQKAGVMVLGGGGEDELTGGLGADTLVGGLDSDTLTGGLGSDTFVFAKHSGDIAGVTGDVIKDFNFGKTGGTNADTISLYQLFDSTVVSQLGKGARDDAGTLSAYLKLEWTKLDSNLQMVCSVDKDGRSNFSKLFTMTDLIGSVGSGTYQANQADMSLLNGTESTNALLQKMLEEGRLVVQ